MKSFYNLQLSQKLKSLFKGVSLIFFVAGITSCAQPGSMMQVNNKLDVLEERIVALEHNDQASTSKLRKKDTDDRESLSVQIVDLQTSLKGIVETLDQIKQEIKINSEDQTVINEHLEGNEEKIDTLQKRLGDQLIELEKIRDFFKASIESNSVQELPESLSKVMKMFKEKQFEKAAKGFVSFREQYPESSYVDDALYFIAYGHFLREDFENASLYFFELIRQYPQSNRKDEAKWWLASLLEQTGDRNGSIDLYRELAQSASSEEDQHQAESRLKELNNLYAHQIKHRKSRRSE